MPVQDTAEATAHAAPEARADRRLLIGGRLVATHKVFSSTNPAKGEVIGASA